MKKKINSALLAIAMLSVISTAIIITFLYYGLFQRQVRSDLELSAKLLRDTHFFEGNSVHLEKNSFVDIKDLRITWVDDKGNVLYDNGVEPEALINHKNRPEIATAFEKGEGESIRKSETMHEDSYYHALLLSNATVLRVSINAKNLASVFFSVMPMVSFILICIMALSIIFSHFLTLQIIKPIEEMAENIENKNFDAPYKELLPFADLLKKQHADVLGAALARQDFTANVSHELKTPLTAISGYAELLENGMVSKEKEKHFYKEIRGNSERLFSIINDIIKLSEIDRVERDEEFKETDLCEAVKESVELLRFEAEQKGVNLYFKGESAFILARRDMIKELAENLIQNAIRYNKDGGSVEVTVFSGSEGLKLEVADTGIGIPLSDKERIFERFYKVDKSRSREVGGTGLGLAIVKNIATLHGAKIAVESELGIGTKISVIF